MKIHFVIDWEATTQEDDILFTRLSIYFTHNSTRCEVGVTTVIISKTHRVFFSYLLILTSISLEILIVKVV